MRSKMATEGNINLLQIDKGILKKDAFVVIVKTEWNAAIVDELEAGCRRVLEEFGVKNLTLVVPGAVEIPFAIKRHWDKSWDSGSVPDAYIAFGCVIRGGTPHFDYVCRMVTDGILQLNLNLQAPVIFGVLTVDNEEQARERIGGKHGHKGEEAAITALKMIPQEESFEKL